jgi:mono/diheme cytochrome c family protein
MWRAGAWLGGSLLLATAASAQTAAALYQGADLALGERLIRENRCAECHTRKVGGDGNGIYRPLGRVNNPGALRGMVEQCNLELNLTLFPDEVTAISAVLNRDHYRFK